MQLPVWKPIKNNSRLYFAIAAFITFNLVIAALLYSFKNSISFYKTPSQLTILDINSNYAFRIGGYVTKIKQQNQSLIFQLSDGVKQIEVEYKGYIPRLFRLRQGVVALGCFKNKIFIASEILTKHDEKYHPVNVNRINTL